jgi:hypothetical protein
VGPGLTPISETKPFLWVFHLPLLKIVVNYLIGPTVVFIYVQITRLLALAISTANLYILVNGKTTTCFGNKVVIFNLLKYAKLKIQLRELCNFNVMYLDALKMTS